MIVLGVLVLLAVVAVSVVAIARGGDPVSFKVGSLTFDTDGTGMFLAGAGTLVLAIVGLWLLSKGLAHSRHRRQEMRELRDRAARNDEAARREQGAALDHNDTGADTGADNRADTTTDTTADTTRVDESGRHVDTDDHFDSTPRDR